MATKTTRSGHTPLDGPRTPNPTLLRADDAISHKDRLPLDAEASLALLLDALVYASPQYVMRRTLRMDQAIGWAVQSLAGRTGVKPELARIVISDWAKARKAASKKPAGSKEAS